MTPTRNSRLCRGGCSLIAKRRPAGLPEQQNQDDGQRRYDREGAQQLGKLYDHGIPPIYPADWEGTARR